MSIKTIPAILLAGLCLASASARADTPDYQEGCDSSIAAAMTSAKNDEIQQQSNIAQGLYRYLHNASFSAASCIDSLIPSLVSSGFNLSGMLASVANQAMSRLSGAACNFIQSTVGKEVNSWNSTVGSAMSQGNSYLSRYTTPSGGGLNAGTQTFQLTSRNNLLRTNIQGLYSRAAQNAGINASEYGGTQLSNAANGIASAAFQRTIGAISSGQ